MLYFVTERNDSGTFHIENTTGILKLRSHLLTISTFRLLIGACLQNGGKHPRNATTRVIIQVVAHTSLTSRTTVDFKTEKLGFLRGEQTSNLMRQFGFFANGYPGTEGSLRASVGAISAEVSYTITRVRAVHVSAVLVSKDVYCDRPGVHVIAQVQDPSFNVRTLVDESEVVVQVKPSANLSSIDVRQLQVTELTDRPTYFRVKSNDNSKKL